MNNVTLIGRLTKDPDTRYTGGSQTAITSFTLAVDRPTKDKETDFIRVKVFGKQAETCEKYSYKGQRVAIAGSIQTGSFTDRDGNTVYTTDVVASRVEFLEFKKSDQREEKKQEPTQESFEDVEADIPF